jgi:RNA polymerase sigma factor (sigma-70 family)
MSTSVRERDQTDDQLAAAAARRDESGAVPRAAQIAFEELYRRHAPLLFAFLAARAPASDREDLHQEVWRRVWQYLPGHFRGGNLSAWLHEIARNVRFDHGRKRKAVALDDGEVLEDPRVGQADDRLLEDERREALRRCLEMLIAPADAIVKARLAGEDYSEICRRLGLEPKRAHKLYHTAKEQLKTCVERALP